MTTRHNRASATAAITAAATAFAVTAYQKDIRAARRRIESEGQLTDLPQGPIEFGESGDGPAVLVIHGAGGGFDQGLDLGRELVGDGYRIVAPSRFGYLGTPLPRDASAEAHADAHCRLLDALKLGRVPVVGISAGGPSAMQFCLRHPDRCAALILVVPLAYPAKGVGAGPPSPWFQAMLTAISSSDVVFWAATKIARAALIKKILGTPIEVVRRAKPADRALIEKLLRDILPISRRIAGLRNEGAVAATLTHRYPLDQIRIPTLIIGPEDCGYGTYLSCLDIAAHIAGARLVTFATGGHLLVGHSAAVRAEIDDFLTSVREIEQVAAVGLDHLGERDVAPGVEHGAVLEEITREHEVSLRL